jgi:ribosomal protein L11 methyltransferase
VKHYPALDVHAADSDLVTAAADAFAPTAVEERGDVTRVFFADAASRDAAAAELSTMFGVAVAPIEVPDEDWARRSQENLQPVTVGRITIVPEPFGPSALQPCGPSARQPFVITIRPSMGFGTGHHATTRLCLAALQELGVAAATVLDIGTGSGVLAIAADRLGAAEALGIDTDADAIQSARENLLLNPAARRVRFEIADLQAAALAAADVVLANLTAGLLVRAADRLLAAVRPGGLLVVSGLHAFERPEVSDTLTRRRELRLVWQREEDGWAGLAFRC